MDPEQTTNKEPSKPQVVIAQSPKSLGIALLLTFIFGPLGLLYSTVMGGIIMIIIGIIVGLLTFGLGALVIWPICMIWAFIAVKSYNKKLYASVNS